MKVKELLKKHNFDLNLMTKLMEIEFGDVDYIYDENNEKNKKEYVFKGSYKNKCGRALHTIIIDEKNNEIRTILKIPGRPVEGSKINKNTLHYYTHLN